MGRNEVHLVDIGYREHEIGLTGTRGTQDRLTGSVANQRRDVVVLLDVPNGLRAVVDRHDVVSLPLERLDDMAPDLSHSYDDHVHQLASVIGAGCNPSMS